MKKKIKSETEKVFKEFIKFESKIVPVGNSLGIRIPMNILKKLGLKRDAIVIAHVDVERGEITIIKSQK